MRFTYKKEEYQVAVQALNIGGKIISAAEIAKDKNIHGPMVDKALEKYGEADFHKNGVVKFYTPSPAQEAKDAHEARELIEARAEIEALKAQIGALKAQIEALEATSKEEVIEEKSKNNPKK